MQRTPSRHWISRTGVRAPTTGRARGGKWRERCWFDDGWGKNLYDDAGEPHGFEDDGWLVDVLSIHGVKRRE